MNLIGIKDECCKKDSNLIFFMTESSNVGFVRTRSAFKCKVCNRILYTEWFSQNNPEKAKILNSEIGGFDG